jgi:hypothetical protein
MYKHVTLLQGAMCMMTPIALLTQIDPVLSPAALWPPYAQQ